MAEEDAGPCPACHRWVPGQHELGVLYDPKPDGCGWCSHASRTDGVCGFCGDVESTDNLAELMYEAALAVRVPVAGRARWLDLPERSRRAWEAAAERARVSMRLVVASELRAAAEAARALRDPGAAGLARAAELAISGHPGVSDLMALTSGEVSKMIRETIAKELILQDPAGDVINQVRVVVAHWRDQEGVNGAEIDKLSDLMRRFEPEAKR